MKSYFKVAEANLFINLLNLLIVSMIKYLNFLRKVIFGPFNLISRLHFKTNLHSIPGPLALPLFGSSWLYWPLVGLYEHEKWHESNLNKYEKYGSVVREEVLFNFPLIHLFDGQDVLKVLRFPSEHPIRPGNEADVFYRRFRSDLYPDDGIVNLNGPQWKHLRSLLTPPLTDRRTTERYAGAINEVADDFVRLILNQYNNDNNKSDEKALKLPNFPTLVYRLGLETVSVVALDKRMGLVDCSELSLGASKILSSIKGYQSASNEAMYGLPFWKYLPAKMSGVFTRLVEHKDFLFHHLGAIVDESLAEKNDCFNGSILQLLLKDSRLDLRTIKASVVDYITAGVDTMGNSVTFALALIAENAGIQARLQDELDHFLSKNCVIDVETLSQMTYLRACVTESFRLAPTASQIARVLEEDLETRSGCVVPKGSVVLCHHHVACLQESNFSRADEFAPERWIEGENRGFVNCQRHLVLPFGSGKRACPGKRLAEFVIQLMVAKFFFNFEARVEEPGLNLMFNWLLTPNADLKVKIWPRHP